MAPQLLLETAVRVLAGRDGTEGSGAGEEVGERADGGEGGDELGREVSGGSKIGSMGWRLGVAD